MQARLPRLVMPFVALVALAPAFAQDIHEGAQPRFSSLINIDSMVDNYARLLSRKYTLTPEQEEFTKAYLHDTADRFLGQHKDEMFAIIDEMFAVRGGASITPEEIVAWGQRALPLYDEAKKLIIDGNTQWREILTDEQKKIHDADLELMNTNFVRMDEQLGRIARGEMTVDEFRRGPASFDQPRRPFNRNTDPALVKRTTPADTPHERTMAPPPDQPTVVAPPKAQASQGAEDQRAAARERLARIRAQRQGELAKGTGAAAGGTPASPRTTRHGSTRGAAPANRTDFESDWERYVNDFIARYQLNEEQQQRARSLLSECQEAARSYLARRQATIDNLDRQIEQLKATPEKSEETQRLNKQKEKLREPIARIFETRLKPRLERLPTRAQREAVEGAGDKRQDSSPAPTSRPARPRRAPTNDAGNSESEGG